MNKSFIILVPGGGVEPPRAEARRILSPLRLPVPPSRLGGFTLGENNLAESHRILWLGWALAVRRVPLDRVSHTPSNAFNQGSATLTKELRLRRRN